MTKFLLILEQESQGCDHSIDCGVKVVGLMSENLHDAIHEAKREIGGTVEFFPTRGEWGIEGGYWEEDVIRKATIYRVETQKKIMVNQTYKEVLAKLKMKEEDEEKTQRRRLYESLKKEFGDD